MTRCPRNHDALKLDRSAWGSLPFIGIQRFPACGDEPELNLELRNCGTCGSTLAVEIKESK